MLTIYDAVGLFAIALSTYGYARVQWQRDFAKRMSYSVLNLASSALMFVSLMKSWNLASFISNALLGLISIYGMWRCYKYIRQEKIAPALPVDSGEQDQEAALSEVA